MAPIPVKTIKYRGRNIQYKTVRDLAKTLKITVPQAKQIRDDIKNNDTSRVISTPGGMVRKIDIRDRPLLLRNFNINPSSVRSNKIALSANTSVPLSNNTSISKSLEPNTPYMLSVDVTSKVMFSPPNSIPISFTANISDTPSNIARYSITQWNNLVRNYMGNQSIQDFMITDSRRIIRPFGQTDARLKISNMTLQDNTPLNITTLFNQTVELNEGENNKCIERYFKRRHGDKYDYSSMHTTDDIYEYCKKYRVNMIAYDISGNIIKQFKSKSKGRKPIYFIAYNNHLYPLENKYLESRPKKKYDEMIHVDNVIESLTKLIKNGNVPSDVQFSDDVISYVFNNKKYICNNDYDRCKEIMSMYGIENKIHDNVTLSTVGSQIESLFIENNISSFFPYSNKFVKGGYNYVCDNHMKYKNMDCKSIDKNNSYPHALYSLDYLIRCDVRVNDIKKYNGEHIELHYMYSVSPKESSILIPESGLYSGKHLQYCKNEGIEFTIHDYIQTTYTPNYYRAIIDDLKKRNLSKSEFKTILNIMIGKFEKNCGHKKIYKEYVQIANNDESIRVPGFVHSLDDNINIIFKNKESVTLYNKFPIAMQVKDQSRITLYEMMKKQNAKTDDIVMIRTDSITFKPNFNIDMSIIKPGIDGWKICNPCWFESDVMCYRNEAKPLERIEYDISLIAKNIIGNCYAGCGKTYKIINNIIPKCQDMGYIVLTPCHSAAKHYKLNKCNVDVIQRYTLQNKIPDENVVIIDECGMVDGKGWDLIFKCALLGKQIYAYGDFNQLPPVGTDDIKINEWFMNKIFYNKESLTTNYRNDFTKEYYDMLINSNDIEYNLGQVLMHGEKSYYDADVVICYTNKSCDKYNKMITQRKGINDMATIGVNVICNTNALRSYGIFNKFMYTIKNIDSDSVTLDDTLNEITIKKYELYKHFSFGYARTIYSIQGESIPKYYYAPEDKIFLSDGRVAYTVISRKKTKNVIS